MEYKFFKTLVALGTVTTIFVVGNEIAENLKNEPKKSEVKEKPVEEEVLETFKNTDLYVFDRAYRNEIRLGKDDFTSSYFIMADTHTPNYQRFQNVFDADIISYINYRVGMIAEKYNISQAASIMVKNTKGEYFSTEFLDTKDVWSLNEFLKKQKLEFLIKDFYTSLDLENIKDCLDQTFSQKKKYYLDDLKIYDFTGKDNFPLDTKCFLLAKDQQSVYDGILMKLLSKKENTNDMNMTSYQVLGLENINRAILTDQNNTCFLHLFVGGNVIEDVSSYLNNFVRVLNLRDFLIDNNLDYLIKDYYEEDEVQELYAIIGNILNENNFTRVLK